MNKKIKQNFKGMTEEQMERAIAEGIRLAVNDFLHKTKAEIDKKGYDFFKWFIHKIIWLIVTGASIGLVHAILYGKYQKIADWIINNIGN